MKKGKLLFVLTLFIAFMGCKSDTSIQDNIVGSWKVADAKFKLKDKSNVEEGEIRELEKLMLNIVFEFKKEGVYALSSSEGSVSGDWNYDTETKVISLKSHVSDDAESFTISQLKEKSLVMFSDKAGGTSTLTLERLIKETP